LPPPAQHLTSQAMKVLRWAGRIDDLNIVLRGQGQKTFHPRARMLRTLPFKTMWQQHNQTAQAQPLVFRAGDELVDNHLGCIEEITKLSLPSDETFGIVQAITILEPKNTRF